MSMVDYFFRGPDSWMAEGSMDRSKFLFCVQDIEHISWFAEVNKEEVLHLDPLHELLLTTSITHRFILD